MTQKLEEKEMWFCREIEHEIRINVVDFVVMVDLPAFAD